MTTMYPRKTLQLLAPAVSETTKRRYRNFDTSLLLSLSGSASGSMGDTLSAASRLCEGQRTTVYYPYLPLSQGLAQASRFTLILLSGLGSIVAQDPLSPAISVTTLSGRYPHAVMFCFQCVWTSRSSRLPVWVFQSSSKSGEMLSLLRYLSLLPAGVWFYPFLLVCWDC